MLCVCAALCASPAQAASRHIAGLIGAAGGTQGGLFFEPSDVAVYHGDAPDPFDDRIYVSEAATNNARVQRLDAFGNFELMWGRDVVRAGAPGDIGDGFEVCRHTVSGADTCKAGEPGGGAGELSRPIALGVSGATGHVYVMDQYNRRVQEHDGEGGFVRAWGWGVATGSARFEICTERCRAGLVGGPGGDAHGGQIANPGSTSFGDTHGTIAVSPRPHHDVFVGDPGNRRVQQFTANGRFVRAWGWGVATGERKFEVCTADGGCRSGRRSGLPSEFSAAGWPRQLAVDNSGIVYTTEPPLHDRVVRFATASPPTGPDAGDALLAPLRPGKGLSHGETAGLEIDPESGELILLRNPFGPSVVNFLPRPGRAGSRGHGVSGGSFEDFGFVQSVRGLGVGSGGVLYVPISNNLDPRDPGTVLGDCRARVGSAQCQGLAVFATEGNRPLATITGAAWGPAGSAMVDVELAPAGVIRYRLQVTTDGLRWRTVSSERYATGEGLLPLRVALSGLRPGVAYRARVQVATFDEDRYRWTGSSNSRVLATSDLRIGMARE